MKNGSNCLNSLLEEKELRCVRTKLKNKLIPLMNEIFLYANNNKTRNYAATILRDRLLKRREHYEKEVFQFFIDSYIQEIKQHFSIYKHNLSLLKPEKKESRLDMQDISAYLDSSFHVRTFGGEALEE